MDRLLDNTISLEKIQQPLCLHFQDVFQGAYEEVLNARKIFNVHAQI